MTVTRAGTGEAKRVGGLSADKKEEVAIVENPGK